MYYPSAVDTVSTSLTINNDTALFSDIHCRKQILLVDAGPLRRQCLEYALLARLKECAIESVSRIDDFKTIPDLILLDISAAGSSQEELQDYLCRVRTQFQDRPIVALADASNLRMAKYAFRCGVKGFLPSSATVEAAVAAVRLVLNGGLYVPQELIELWTGASDVQLPVKQERSVSMLPVAHTVLGGVEDRNLTEREAQVVECLRLGKPNKIIAYQLRISESTVKVHMRNIMRKLSATNRTQVAFLTISSPGLSKLGEARAIVDPSAMPYAMSGEPRGPVVGDSLTVSRSSDVQVLTHSRDGLPKCQ